MYELTLTHEERRAIDWVGDRYWMGAPLRRLLLDYLPDGAEWDDLTPLTFRLPEHAAWELDGLAEREDYLFPCFAPPLKAKLLAFCESVV